MRMQIVSSQNGARSELGQNPTSRASVRMLHRLKTSRGCLLHAVITTFARKRLAYLVPGRAPLRGSSLSPAIPSAENPSPPFAHDMRVALELPGNRRAGNPIGSHQNYPCSHHQPGFRIPLADDLF